MYIRLLMKTSKGNPFRTLHLMNSELNGLIFGGKQTTYQLLQKSIWKILSLTIPAPHLQNIAINIPLISLTQSTRFVSIEHKLIMIMYILLSIYLHMNFLPHARMYRHFSFLGSFYYMKLV